MQGTETDGEQRERRAVDGLDWRPPPLKDSPEISPPPTPVPGFQPPAPAQSATPRTGLLIAVAAGAALLGGLVTGGIVARFANDRGIATSSNATAFAGTTLSVEQTSAIADVASTSRSDSVTD